MTTGELSENDLRYVERIRQGIATSDRIRRYAIAFYAALTVASVALAIWAIRFSGLELGQGMAPGFGIGLALGTVLGLNVLVTAHGLLNAIVRGGRSQRLLVRYFDEIRACNLAKSDRQAGG